MGMGIYEYILRGAVRHESRQHVGDASALLAPRVKLPVAIRSRSAFAEAIIALGVEVPFA